MARAACALDALMLPACTYRAPAQEKMRPKDNKR